ncbi:Glycosyl transferase family 31, partial [Trinorchestia longiramus]
LMVLIMVTTAPAHHQKRRAVRQTWGHFGLRKDVALAFLAGVTEPAVQTEIDKEHVLYGDIIQSNNIDQYRNLTLKTVSMFEWVQTYCSEVPFVLKTDDDMFINMPLLLNFIEAQKTQKRVIFGRVGHNWKPIRNKKSKYFVDPSNYSLKTFPDFTTGPAYLFTSDIVSEMFSTLLNTTYLFLEDVLTTGIVGEYLGIRRVGDTRFKNDKTSLSNTCKIMDIISIHMVGYAEQFDLYKRTLDGKTTC